MGSVPDETFLKSVKYMKHFHLSKSPEKVFLERLANLD